VVFIGGLVRPALRQLHFDLGTLRILPRLLAAYRGGDDHLLTSLARIVESEGFRVVASHEIAPEILMPEGALGSRAPTADEQADISLGLAVLRAMSPFDVGQAAIVAGSHVLALEAAEGTDLMLQRVADLRGSGRIRLTGKAGVLVKAPKSGQDWRFDLPSIGPQTVEGVARAGLAGLAVVAGQTVIADADAVRRAADREGIFAIGTRENQ
jgi:DUF1009 family protein